MHEGQPVEVHTTFDDSWSPGFEIAAVMPEGYRVRRLSDGSLLPGVTSSSDVRPCSSPTTTQGSKAASA